MTQKFRVHFEATAAIGIEIAVEASDEDEAKCIAEGMYERGELMFSDVVSELLKPPQLATDAFATASDKPITYVTVEEDEEGFEVVDVFIKENDR